MAQKEYKKIAGSGRTFVSVSTLWLGRDHLLAVETVGYTEHYRRFYFKDIQALLVQRNRHRLFGNLSLGLLGLLIMAIWPGISLFTNGWDDFLWPSLIMPVFLLLFILFNSILGPGCDAWVLTPVSEYKLKPVRRLRQFRKLLVKVEPLIAEAQGRFAPGELESRLDEVPDAPQALKPLLGSRRESVVLRHDSGLFHKLTIGLLAVFLIVWGVRMATAGMWTFFLGMALLFVILVIDSITLARQVNTDLPLSLRKWAWAVMIYVMVSYAVVYFAFVINGVMLERGGESDPFTGFMKSRPDESVAAALIYFTLVGGSFLLTVLGIMMFRRPRLTMPSPKPPELPVARGRDPGAPPPLP